MIKTETFKDKKCPNCKASMQATLLDAGKAIPFNEFHGSIFSCSQCNQSCHLNEGGWNLIRSDDPPPFVAFVGLDGELYQHMRLKKNRYSSGDDIYYRDCGDWGVGFVFTKDDKLFTRMTKWEKEKRGDFLDGQELVVSTEEAYRADNEGYLEDDPFGDVRRRIATNKQVDGEEMEKYREFLGEARPAILYHKNGVAFVKQKNGKFLDTNPPDRYEKKNGYCRGNYSYEELMRTNEFSTEKPTKSRKKANK